MAESGGSSTVSGIGYEQWVFVRFMIDILRSNSNDIVITAQKKHESKPLSPNSIEIIAIDDLVIEKSHDITHYTIKHAAPKKIWNVGALKSEGVLKAFKDQHEKTPERNLILITQSDSPILSELKRISNCNGYQEVEKKLGKTLLKDWENLKKILDYDNDKLLKLSKKISIKQLSYEEMQAYANDVLSERFNSSISIGDYLFNFSFDKAKWKIPVKKCDIIEFLEGKGILEKSTYSIDSIKKNLIHVSSNLEVIDSPFNINRIPRKESNEIFDWINCERIPGNSNSRLLTVTGKAGMGKTSILQDTLTLLQNQNIPALAIKADKISFTDFEELKKRLGLIDSPEKVFSLLSDEHPLSVLMIDQIDALSMGLSSDRSQIDLYKELIARISKIPNVLIILSCRTYDLNNDSDLRQYNNEKIEIGSLSEQEVYSVLETYGVDTLSISENTISLLSIPLHLAIYLDIATTEKDISNISTHNELYNRLWKKRITNQENSERLIDALYRLSNRMYESQTLKTSKLLLEEEFSGEIAYLNSSGLIYESKNDLLFFHQTFFDYTIARLFVRNRKKLTEDLLSQPQGIYQRPRIKAVLEFLYEADRSLFVQQINEILFGANYRTHIKFLILNILGSIEIEDPDFKQLGKKILADEILNPVFVKSILSGSWIDFLSDEKPLFAKEIVDAIIRGLSNMNGKRFQNEIIKLLDKYKNDIKPSNLAICLSNCVNINNPVFLELYSSVKKEIIDFDYCFTSILTKALEDQHLEFVVQELINYEIDLETYEIEQEGDYLPGQFRKLIESVFEISTDDGYLISKQFFIKTCRVSHNQYQPKKRYFDCNAFDEFNGLTGRRDKEHYLLYKWIIDYICQKIDQDKEFGIKQIEDFLLLDYEITACVALDVMSRKASQIFNEIDELLAKYDLWDSFKNSGELFQYLFGNVINLTFNYLSPDQKEAVFTSCMSMPEWLISDNKQYRNQWAFYDSYKLLTRIPEEYILSSSQKNKTYSALKRKYGIINWERPRENGVLVGSGSVPLPEKAYDSMSVSALKESFKKVEKNGRSRVGEPTKYGHAEHFQLMIIKEPEKYFDLVKELINELPQENDIPHLYPIKGLTALTESSIDPLVLKSLIHDFLVFDSKFEFQTELINIISTFLEKDLFDDVMFDYIKNLTLTSSSKNKTNYPSYLINILIKLKDTIHLHKQLFELLDIIALGQNEKLQLHLLSNIAYLNKYNRSKAHNIFVKLINNIKSLEKYKYAQSSLHYMVNVNYSNPLKTFIKTSFDKVVDQKVQRYYGKVSAYLWLNEFKDANDLIITAEKRSPNFKSGILSFFIDTICQTPKNQNIYNIAYNKLYNYLNEGEEVYFTYQKFIRSIDQQNFKDHFDFLKVYVVSPIRNVKYRDRAFIEKLFDLSSTYPHECIELCELDIQSGLDMSQEIYSRYDTTAFNVLIKSFNSLSKLFDNEAREKALNLIDIAYTKMINQHTIDIADVSKILDQNEIE